VEALARLINAARRALWSDQFRLVSQVSMTGSFARGAFFLFGLSRNHHETTVPYAALGNDVVGECCTSAPVPLKAVTSMQYLTAFASS
jgi:hypothetical protein